MKPLGLLLLAALLTGCTPMQIRSYDLTVRNQTAQPLTIWLTKNGPAWERGWKSPEDLAIESPAASEPIAGVVVPPGRSARTGKVTGKFAPATDAVLRIYRGQRSFNELLAISRDSPDRIDYILPAGQSVLVVEQDSTGLIVRRVDK